MRIKSCEFRPLLEALPIWGRQIETARAPTEAAIVSLSKRFSGIAGRLDQALGPAETSDRQFAISMQP